MLSSLLESGIIYLKYTVVVAMEITVLRVQYRQYIIWNQDLEY